VAWSVIAAFFLVVAWSLIAMHHLIIVAWSLIAMHNIFSMAWSLIATQHIFSVAWSLIATLLVTPPSPVSHLPQDTRPSCSPPTPSSTASLLPFNASVVASAELFHDDQASVPKF
jgi:hypothetical protein